MIQLQGNTVSATNGLPTAPLNIFYSTSDTTNNLFEEFIRQPILRSAEFDDNLDGKTDRLEINIQMPIQAYESILSMKCFVYHNVQFNDKTKLVMDGGSYFEYSTGIPMSNLVTDGSIQFKQNMPLHAKGGYQVPYEKTPLFPSDFSSNYISASDVSMKSILNQYYSRNCKLDSVSV